MAQGSEVPTGRAVALGGVRVVDGRERAAGWVRVVIGYMGWVGERAWEAHRDIPIGTGGGAEVVEHCLVLHVHQQPRSSVSIPLTAVVAIRISAGISDQAGDGP